MMHMMEETSCELWMGDLDPYMDENFLRGVFAYFGFHIQQVKWIKNRQTGAMARYCFVEFNDPLIATQVLEKLSNQFIPGSNGKYFKLNRASKKVEEGQQEYTVFVGDLSKDVTSQMLQDFFHQYYPSVRRAKVVEDDSGNSKGYGFVRFLDESERNDCYSCLNGATGLGKKAITVKEAFAPKHRSASTMPTPSSHQSPLTPYFLSPPYFSTFTQPYWSSGLVSDTWQHQQITYQHSVMQQMGSISNAQSFTEDLEDHSPPLDVDGANRKMIERENKLQGQLDDVRWITQYSQTAAVK